MLNDLTKFPAPYFGGKTHAAPAVWAALGDVDHYVEPFCGTMAVLLKRPHLANRPYFSETVNDVDGLLVNAIRSLQMSPDATADAASWTVSEADLTARHLALVRFKAERDLERLMGDPLWHDPVVGGWWLWGLSCWIGGGWCTGDGPWVAGDDGRIQRREGTQLGVNAQLPLLSSDGQGVNRPGTRELGVGAGEGEEFHPWTMPELRRWFAYLSARLRHVRILNGDWRRTLTDGALLTLPVRMGDGIAGVFLDPPYAATAGRHRGLYTHDDLQVAHAAAEWAIARSRREDAARVRIVFAGFEGEHADLFLDAGWREVEWFKKGFLRGGMGNQGKREAGEEGPAHQQGRERLWLSPSCLSESAQGRLLS